MDNGLRARQARAGGHALCDRGRLSDQQARAEAIQANLKLTNPRAIDKRFECIAEQTGSPDSSG